MGKNNIPSIDEYIKYSPLPAQKKLAEMRRIVKEVAPEAQEKISYRMPAFFLGGILIYFAAFAKHIGFYPGANGVAAFEKELSKYKHAKGSIQFPINEPLPVELIKKIVKYKIKENLKKKK
jgi:uncharacterized protein YdhG (YjbR/CyaY superfamily)